MSDIENKTSDLQVDDPELPSMDAFLGKREVDKVKTEKRSEQLADAREAKAKKAEERKAAEESKDDDGSADETPAMPQPDGELEEFVNKRKAAKKKDEPEVRLNAKPEAEKKTEPPPTEVEETGEEEEPKETAEQAERRKKQEASALATIARKEAALLEKEKAVEAERARVRHEAEQYAAKAREAEGSVAKIRRELEELRLGGPSAVLKAFGYHVGDAVEDVTSDGKAPNLMMRQLELRTQQHIQALEQRLAASEQARIEAEQVRERVENERVVASYKQDISSFVRENADEYELILAKGDEDRVFRTITEHYEKHGVLPSFKDAADAVENDLLEEAKRLTGKKKIAALFTPQTAPTAPAVQVTQKRDPAGARAKASTTTITDSLASGPAVHGDDDDPYFGMDVDEGLAKLISKHRRKS